MTTEPSSKTLDGLLVPDKGRLKGAVFSLRQSNRPLSRRDIDAPAFPWPSAEEAVKKAQFVLDLYRDLDPREIYDYAVLSQDPAHPLPPFEKIYPPQAEPAQPPQG